MTTSKTQKIYQHLLKHETITSWEAIKLFKATRLAAIIFTFRKKGAMITNTDIVKKIDGQTTRYTRYKLIKPIPQPKQVTTNDKNSKDSQGKANEPSRVQSANRTKNGGKNRS